MRYLHITILCLMCRVTALAQTGVKGFVGTVAVEIIKGRQPKWISSKVEIQVSVQDIDSAWVRSLEQMINESISDDNGAKPGKYAAVVRFIMERDGVPVDVQCLSDPGYGMGHEIVDAVKRNFKWRFRTGNGKR